MTNKEVAFIAVFCLMILAALLALPGVSKPLDFEFLVDMAVRGVFATVIILIGTVLLSVLLYYAWIFVRVGLLAKEAYSVIKLIETKIGFPAKVTGINYDARRMDIALFGELPDVAEKLPEIRQLLAGRVVMLASSPPGVTLIRVGLLRSPASIVAK